MYALPSYFDYSLTVSNLMCRITTDISVSLQMTVIGSGDGTLSRMSSQQSLPVVPEDFQHPSSLPHSSGQASSETSTPPTPHHDAAALTLSSNSYYRCITSLCVRAGIVFTESQIFYPNSVTLEKLGESFGPSLWQYHNK